MSSKITEKDITTRIAVERLGLEVKPEPVRTKRKYTVSPAGHKVKVQAAQLKPYCWKPGQSGNPKGRPVNALSLTAILNRKLSENPADAEAIVNALISLGKRPNLTQLAAIDKIFDRVDGKVAETHRIEGDLPVTLIFRPAETLVNSVPALNDGKTIEGETDG